MEEIYNTMHLLFIGTNLINKVESNLLVPILLPHDIIKGEIKWSGTYLINPFKGNSRQLIALNEYPLALSYFNSNAARLKQRYVAIKKPSEWYRTIDRVYTNVINLPKLLIPDLASDRLIAFDNGKFYPHHSIYYICNSQSSADLKVLGALLISPICTEQIDSKGIKMNSGITRWQAQTLRKIVLPRIADIPQNIKGELIKYFDLKSVHDITMLVQKYIRT